MGSRAKANLFLLSMTMVWGSSFILMKNMLEYMTTFQYLSIRFIVGFLFLAPFVFKKLIRVDWKTLLFGTFLGIFLFAGMAFQVMGLKYTSASNSGLITGLCVIMVPILAAFVLKKVPGFNSILGVLVAFLGMFFLSGGSFTTFNIGDFYTLLCALSFAIQIVLADRTAHKVDPITAGVIQVGIASILNSIVWGFSEPSHIIVNGEVILAIIVTGLFGTAIGFGGQIIAQKYTTPTSVAVIYTSEPLFAVVFALLIPGPSGVSEQLTANIILGCALILIGMLIVELRPFRNRRSRTQVVQTNWEF